MVEVLYNLIDALDLYARYEEGNSEFIYFVPPNDNYKSRQIVLGANIYPIPYIEIRPEYRIYDREFAESYSAQWTVQLHVYF
jgi:hypothetical protein